MCLNQQNQSGELAVPRDAEDVVSCSDRQAHGTSRPLAPARVVLRARRCAQSGRGLQPQSPSPGTDPWRGATWDQEWLVLLALWSQQRSGQERVVQDEQERGKAPAVEHADTDGASARVGVHVPP